MLAYLKGTINYKTSSYLVVNVGNAGYKVYAVPTLLAEISQGEEIVLHLHQYVRENVIELYGFKTREGLEIFEDLISISGVGPKSALKTLTVARPADIRNAIQKGDPGMLTKVSGIGVKTAEKIILELKGKIEVREDEATSPEDSDIIDALVGLGYKTNRAREIVKKIPEDVRGSSARIREALRLLGK